LDELEKGKEEQEELRAERPRPDKCEGDVVVGRAEQMGSRVQGGIGGEKKGTGGARG